MGLSIKNEAVEARVRRLAELTGLGVTEAVDDAVTRRLKELEYDPAAELIRIRAELEAIRARYGPLEPGALWTDDDLYDESGAPK